MSFLALFQSLDHKYTLEDLVSCLKMKFVQNSENYNFLTISVFSPSNQKGLTSL